MIGRGDVLDTFPYHNTPTGKGSNAVSIYYQAIPLKSGKTVQYVTLPDVSQGIAQNQIAMHVFAIAIGADQALARRAPRALGVARDGASLAQANQHARALRSDVAHGRVGPGGRP